LDQPGKPEQGEVIAMGMRKFSRVRFNVIATIATGNRSFSGKVQDLSMNGMFLVTEERLPVDTKVEISLLLVGTDPGISVLFTGRVARVTDQGVGFHFDKIDLDSYTHLKNIIAYNMADAEKVMEEIYQDIDKKISSGT
jgi:hypothetical protein